jgi:L-lysine exporter family protein LysE/ArgO
MISAGITGFLTSLSLILAIGAQNAMILRQGLARSHVFWACLFCAISDAILIALGVAGFGLATARFPALPFILTVGGIAFLICYGCMRLWAAYRGEYDAEMDGSAKPLGAVIMSLAAVTWLNPHVYLDTLALLGAVSVQYSDGMEKLAFGLSAMAASFVFFFSLGYGAVLLAPYFKSARFWRGLDVAIAIVMFAIAFGLYQSMH